MGLEVTARRVDEEKTSDDARWRMLGLLRLRAMTGSQLARALDIPRTRSHYHLSILKDVGLVALEHQQINSGMV